MVSTMPYLVLTSILLPPFAALISAGLSGRRPRASVSIFTGAVLIALAPFLAFAGSFSFSTEGRPIPWNLLIHWADFLLLAVVLIVAVRLKSILGSVFIAIQLLVLLGLEIFWGEALASDPVLASSAVARVTALVVNIVGGLILIYSPGYIHRHFADPDTGKERFFFFFLLLFPGAMNGLVFSNHLLWLLFFWEVTTVCSFALIAVDRTEEAVASALKALWMTMLGGVALVSGIVLVHHYGGFLRLDQLTAAPASGPVLLGVGLLCFAGLTKAAQVPFQGWLIDAMVAPAPVSALLHSSTMVKAGVYLILILSPAFAGTFLASGLALIGAMSFLAMGAVAVSQRHGKRILAYSTVMNLGMIIVCAALGTAAATAAAILLIVFHAVSKALLFLTVGTAAQATGSSELDGLRGLFRTMPLTSVLMALGLLTLLLPPFGLMIGKWLALQSAAGRPLVIALLAVGTAFHLMLYARWAGDLLWGRAAEKAGQAEKLPPGARLSMMALAALAVGLVPLVPTFLVDPSFFGFPGGGVDASVFAGAYPGILIFGALLCAAAGFAAVVLRRLPPAVFRTPYCCGAEAKVDGQAGFKGPMNVFEPARFSDYHLAGSFGNQKIVFWLNAAAVIVMVVVAAGISATG
ncbi:MAG: NADH-quinone oxidoreductase subunit L [Desulfobacterales bacterium]|nr:NADH-quinone oxidoreductase subunit L [Desulfobacterales bacterium]